MSHPAVSLIVLAWNHAAQSAELLASLDRATDPETEVVLVDNGSTDGTADLFRRFARRHRRTALVLLDENTGYSRGNNLGALAASGRLLVFLNNDMAARPGCFDPYALWLDDAEVGVAGIRLVYADGRIQHAGIALRHFGHPAPRRFRCPAAEATDQRPRKVPAVTGACLGIRHDLFEALGGFDEGYRLLYQDVDLCLRAWQLGFRTVYDPRATMIHHESVTASSAKTAAVVDADWGRFAEAWHDALSAIRAASARVLSELLAGRRLVIYGTGRLARLVAGEARQSGMALAAFADSQSLAAGDHLDGLPVIAPAEIDRLSNVAILIAAMYETDARQRLHEAGVRSPILPSEIDWPVVEPILRRQPAAWVPTDGASDLAGVASGRSHRVL